MKIAGRARRKTDPDSANQIFFRHFNLLDLFLFCKIAAAPNNK